MNHRVSKLHLNKAVFKLQSLIPKKKIEEAEQTETGIVKKITNKLKDSTEENMEQNKKLKKFFKERLAQYCEESNNSEINL